MKLLFKLCVILWASCAFSQKHYLPQVPVSKITFKEKDQSLHYNFPLGGTVKTFSYYFLENGAVKMVYGKGPIKEALTYISKSKIKYVKGGKEKIGTLKNLPDLLSDASPMFKKLVKNNLALSTLGFEPLYVVDKEAPTSEGFVLLLYALGKLHEFVTDSSGECREETICGCDDDKSDVANCACGQAVTCSLVTTTYCRQSPDGETNCRETTSCIATCL